jgi:hypothetical protein
VLHLTKANKKNNSILNQLLIQVQERFPFTPGPDEIMASLLVDFGDCYANTTSVEYAKALYTIAGEYYGAKATVVDPRIKNMIGLRTKFSHIQPQEGNVEENNIILEGIPYKSLLNENNASGYVINWKKINTDSYQLLSYAGIGKIAHPVQKSASQTKNNQTGKTTTTVSNTKMLISVLVLSFIALTIGIIIYKKRRTNKP